jgi:hypothetical protein
MNLNIVHLLFYKSNELFYPLIINLLMKEACNYNYLNLFEMLTILEISE